MEFLPLERQLFPRSLGEALAALVRRRWPRDTAKHAARHYGFDLTTAANVVKGHASERTITKAIAADGWGLGAPLIEAMTGQTYADFLQSRITETERVRSRLTDHKARVDALIARRRALVDGPADRARR